VSRDKMATSHWKRQRIIVLRRDAYTCSYCGCEANEVDHVIPRAKGGSHELDNLVASCKKCNLAKSSRGLGAFLAMTPTPPALPAHISLKTTGTVPNGPCTGQTGMDE